MIPHTYLCEGFRPAKAWDAKEAAEVFADRLARRWWGRSAFCHHVRRDSWSESGRRVTFEAFIGTPAEGGGCAGRNVWLTVYRAEPKEDA